VDAFVGSTTTFFFARRAIVPLYAGPPKEVPIDAAAARRRQA
jgi:hypothetical protein